MSDGENKGPPTDASWEQLKADFAKAIELSGVEREQFLLQVKEDRPELHDDLQALLDTSTETETNSVSLIEASVGEAIASVAGEMGGDLGPSIETGPVGAGPASDISRWVGQEFGPYRVVAPIARGGMGEVLRAERIDGEYRQEVALKVLATGKLDQDASRRFREERQILARLNHPGIARILDGGTTSDGVTYLVMEFIDGEQIDRYCRANSLSVKAVMELFRNVCAAVEYAHSKLIVHRDIKPANILVDESGQPKLLDFGIAKLLDPPESADMADTTETTNDLQTEVTQRRMTREYASPEQLLGLPISTSSDIYSLGVLLYELLTQCRPRSLSGLRPSELEDVIFNTAPTRPSEAVESQMVGKANALRGDVDNIVLMALSAAPEERYGSAQQFSADIRRWLTNEPVVAHRRSLRYVATKFLQRNRWWVLSATAAVLALSMALTYHLEQLKAEALRTSRVASFLSEMLRSTTPDRVGAAEVTTRTLLDSARDELRFGLMDEPQVRASLLGTIGVAYSALGQDVDAIAALEEAVELARDTKNPKALSTQLRQLGQAIEKTNDLDRALSTLEESLSLAQRSAKNTIVEADALRALAHLQHLRGEYVMSIDNYNAALKLYESLGTSETQGYASALTGLGQSLGFVDKQKEAVARLEQALTVLQKSAPNDRLEVLKYKHNLATALIASGEDERAEPLLREVVALERGLLGEDNAELDAAMVVLGLLYQRLGRLDEAEPLLADALATSQRLRGEQHRYTGYNRVVYGKLLTSQKRYAEGEAQFTAALRIYAGELEPDHPYIASAHVGYASLLLSAGRPLDAEKQVRSALVVCAQALPPNHWLAASAEGLLGMSLGAQGKVTPARRHLEAAINVLSPMPGRQSETERLRDALARLE